MSIREPIPGSFEHLLRVVSLPCEGWVRLTQNPPTEPYYSRSASKRFDDPSAPAGSRFGVLYVAEDLEAAFCETLLHENSLFQGGHFVVSQADVDARKAIGFRAPSARKLKLVDLTGAALKRLGLSNEISAGPDYQVTQRWAKAIHDARPDADGLKYVSRQNNRKRCFAIFDRAALRRRGRASGGPSHTAAMSRLMTKYAVIAV